MKKDTSDIGTLVLSWVGGGGLVKQGSWRKHCAGAHVTMFTNPGHTSCSHWINTRSERASQGFSLS